MHWQNTPHYSNKQKIIGTALLLAAIISSWLVFQTAADKTPVKKTAGQHFDAFMNNVHAIHFNQSGRIEAEFFTPSMQHYPVNNVTEMNNPRFIIHIDGRAPWEISALNGKAYDGIKRFALWNQVVGYEAKSPANPEATITTDSLMIFPSQKYAETDKELIAQQPGLRIKSTGARICLNNHTIQLLEKVRGVYDPQH